MRRLLLLLLLCTAACRKCPERVPPFTLQEFLGRDEIVSYGKSIRRPVYHAKVPKGWKRIDPNEQEPLTDSRKPIVSFVIEENLHLRVHTFPTDDLDERIPPVAQIERWKQQLKNGKCQVQSVGHGGFAGLFLESCGVLAWSMQLDFDHYQTLAYLGTTVEEEEHFKQMRADYTIKVTGPQELIEKHREELMLFAKSFELIQEIPSRM